MSKSNLGTKNHKISLANCYLIQHNPLAASYYLTDNSDTVDSDRGQRTIVAVCEKKKKRVSTLSSKRERERDLPHLVLLMLLTTSIPPTTLPKTGCWEGVDLSQKSKKELWTVLTKN